jgi:hypothetical protein
VPVARLGEYEVDGLLGRGSVGSVYRARARAGRQAVALKRVLWAGDEHLIEDFRAEAAMLAEIDHPHIAKVVDMVVDDEGLVIVMQHADSGSLADLLRRCVRLSPDEGATLVAKVADALGAAHAHSILHADVKPSNILMDGDGEPLLSDFGLSRWMAEALPSDGAVVGTAEYLDPAVAKGAPPNAASDIYSLGVVCYEVFAGRLPYHGINPVATLRAADRGRAEPLTHAAPAVPSVLAAVVEQSMSRRPQARPSSAGELGDALRSHIEGHRRLHCKPTRVLPTGRGATEDFGQSTGLRTLRARHPAADSRRETPWSVLHSRGPMVCASGVTAAALVLLAGWAFEHHQGAQRSGAACGATTTPAPKQASPSTVTATVLADVAGNGCRVPVTWSSGMATVSLERGRPPDRFALGTANDQLLLGDWNCSRSATPALYRPSTGQVFYFAAWAEPGHDVTPSVAESTAIVDGVPRVIHDGVHGCDRVKVDLPVVRPQ